MKFLNFSFPVILSLSIVATAFRPVKSIVGTWEYKGGIYNNKKEGSPIDYRLERKYGTVGYEAFVIQTGVETEKYEAGTYSIKDETYQETQTYSSQPSALMGKTTNYTCSLHSDTLIFKGKLADGTQVEEYWKKIK